MRRTGCEVLLTTLTGWHDRCKSGAQGGWAAAFILAMLFFSSCTLCRVSAIEQAQNYQAQGYEARIATYDLLLDGKLYGAFLRDHHAQAVVWKDGHYRWVGEFGQLSDKPTFRQGRMTVYWTIDEFKIATNYRR